MAFHLYSFLLFLRPSHPLQSRFYTRLVFPMRFIPDVLCVS